MMDNKEAKVILERYTRGESLPGEEAWVESWLTQYSDGEEQIPHQEIIDAMGEVRKGLPKPVQSVRWIWARIAATAAILFFLAFGIFIILSRQDKSLQLAVVPQKIVPGSNKAILTLSNGKKISLTDALVGKLTLQGYTSLIKKDDGQLVYETNGRVEHMDAPAFNMIQTPKGGQFQVVLPDGSRVWLNAASSLKYPIQFIGNERNVELTGEAYFEIAKDKIRPFIVKTKHQNITVLGTHFNVNVYDDEPGCKTTLLEGSIKISGDGGTAILKPGQCADLLKKVNKLVIRETDQEKSIAWKNGYFDFNDENLITIMRQLSRWYDIEVIYEVGIPDMEFSGQMERSLSMDQMLKLLSKTGTHFKIAGKKIIITAN